MKAVQEALEEVYGGDQSLEAGALVDKLADRCYAVVPVGFTYDLSGVLDLPRRRWWPWARRPQRDARVLSTPRVLP